MKGVIIVEKERGTPSEPGSPPTPRRFPWLVISLVILSWAVFIYSLYKNNCPSKFKREKCILRDALGRLSFQPLRLNPQFGPAGSTLVDLGGFKWNLKKDQTKMWHILSSIFFHRGLESLILATISLLYSGVELERNFGSGKRKTRTKRALIVYVNVINYYNSWKGCVKIGSLYFLSSLGGSLWAAFEFKGSVYVGGSSGVCGLTGGAFAEFFINWHMHDEKFKRFLSLCFGVAINFAIKPFRAAEVSGDIGGLIFGFFLGFLLLIRRQPECAGYEYKHSGFGPPQLMLNYSLYQLVLWVIALICTIIGFVHSLTRYISH